MKPNPPKIIIRILLSAFERRYYWLKVFDVFSETEELNIENAIKTIRENNRFSF